MIIFAFISFFARLSCLSSLHEQYYGWHVIVWMFACGLCVAARRWAGKHITQTPNSVNHATLMCTAAAATSAAAPPPLVSPLASSHREMDVTPRQGKYCPAPRSQRYVHARRRRTYDISFLLIWLPFIWPTKLMFANTSNDGDVRFASSDIRY